MRGVDAGNVNLFSAFIGGVHIMLYIMRLWECSLITVGGGGSQFRAIEGGKLALTRVSIRHRRRR